ncbi:MAG: hypothetical protein COT73_03770 [Bdellovibrio sp. CG10_big_fil_rev_8_21_14_0_10_47_8]|nr:MAG: hypothetical protein COT73_03770 [Bdellovibrio sp. CG10_big_fil_rev_8_21_14_0_10_47_8]
MEVLVVFTSFISEIMHLILHLDQTLTVWVEWMGPWLYLVMFLIIFAETGLVVTPFLPGDSLLFALGALAALGNGIQVEVMLPLLIVAAIIGDSLNYWIGSKMGPAVFKQEDSRFFKRSHLLKAQAFYDRYGAKAIILGRFVPIVRTFVPFVAGIGTMRYRSFIISNVAGAIVWISIFMIAGYYFGNLPAVKTNFHIVIFGVIGVSVLPIIIEYVRLRFKRA